MGKPSASTALGGIARMDFQVVLYRSVGQTLNIAVGIEGSCAVLVLFAEERKVGRQDVLEGIPGEAAQILEIVAAAA